MQYLFPEFATQFWDRLADYPAEETDQALSFVFQALAEEIDAQNAFWCGVVQMIDEAGKQSDSMAGWRVIAFENMHPLSAEEMKKVEAMKDDQDTEPSLTSKALARTAGSFRACHLFDGTFDMETFTQTRHYRQVYLGQGIVDRIWCVAPVNQDAESCFCFDRIGGDQPFTTEDVAKVATALRAIKWFHRRILLSHGILLGDTPLIPSHRRVLVQLLSGQSEKEIADALGLSAETVHSYVREIYRSFNVNSRAQLMALWLNGN